MHVSSHPSAPPSWYTANVDMNMNITKCFSLKQWLTAVLLISLISTVIDAVAVHGLRKAHGQVATGEISKRAGRLLLRDIQRYKRKQKNPRIWLWMLNCNHSSLCLRALVRQTQGAFCKEMLICCLLNWQYHSATLDFYLRNSIMQRRWHNSTDW